MNTGSWLERDAPRWHVACQLNLHIMHATPELSAFPRSTFMIHLPDWYES
jgi:hypothetical protein